MKKRLLTVLLTVLALSIAGCGQNPSSNDDANERQERNHKDPDEDPDVDPDDEPDVDPDEDPVQEPDVDPNTTSAETDEDVYMELYADIMDEYIKQLTEDVDSEDNWVIEANTMDNPLDCYSYRFEDINKDGIYELIIGDYYPIDEHDGYSAMVSIVAIFTYSDGEIVRLVDGWSRNVYAFLWDGTLYNEASSGASSWSAADYSIEGNELVLLEYFYTYMDGDELKYYNNTTGVEDYNRADEISSDEFYWSVSFFESDIDYFSATPLSEYDRDSFELPDFDSLEMMFTGFENEGDEECYFEVVSAENYKEYDFEYGAGDFGNTFVLVAKKDVERLVISRIEYLEDQEFDWVMYCETYFDSIKEGDVICLTLDLGEVLPNYTIYYDGENEFGYQYFLGESGEDGQAYLYEL